MLVIRIIIIINMKSKNNNNNNRIIVWLILFPISLLTLCISIQERVKFKVAAFVMRHLWCVVSPPIIITNCTQKL